MRAAAGPYFVSRSRLRSRFFGFFSLLAAMVNLGILTTANHLILLFSRRALREAHGRRLETISHPRFRPDVLRLRRVAFDLFAQLIDDYAQIFRFFSIFGPPNGLQQSSMGQRLALIGDEVLEDLEFLRGQVHLLAAHRQLPAFEIQRKVLRNKRSQRVTGSVPPQRSANTR